MPQKTDAFRLNVRRFCRMKKMSQERLAHEAGLSPEWLCKMLGGKSAPTLPVCERIATALGESLESLVSTPPTDAQEIPGNSAPLALTPVST